MIQRRSATTTCNQSVASAASSSPAKSSSIVALKESTSGSSGAWKRVFALRQKIQPKLSPASFKDKAAVSRPLLVIMALKLLIVTALVGSATSAIFKASSYLEANPSAGRSLSAELKEGQLYETPDLMKDVDVLPMNQNYRVLESHPQVGERSDSYARLRQEYDRLLPFSPSRSLKTVSQIRSQGFTKYDSLPMVKSKEGEEGDIYDILNCPDYPPKGYPFEWRMVDILTAWPPRDTDRKPQRSIHQGLCVFQYPRDLVKAQNYRDQEVPFVVQGDPHIARSVERWNMPGYMDKLLGHDIQHRTEYSENNHFLYRRPGAAGGETELQWMTYRDWLSKANVTTDKTGPEQEHWYFRLIGCGKVGGGHCDANSSEYLFDELPFFQPTHASPKKAGSLASSAQLYMGSNRGGEEQHGIHCRFGMRGVIAENHYDSGRNTIILLGGSRRYVLSHPKNCPRMSLYPGDHPSARHSNFDWSNGDPSTFPSDFAEHARGNEVVLQAGDALYLPTFWFHYIVSLELNYQCNTRSGYGDENERFIETCG